MLTENFEKRSPFNGQIIKKIDNETDEKSILSLWFYREPMKSRRRRRYRLEKSNTEPEETKRG